METALDTARGDGKGALGRLGTDRASSATPAITGHGRGEVGWHGADRGVALARALGWFSVGLGTAELLMPGAVARLVGLRATSTTTRVLRLAGVREIGQGLGILANPRSKEWLGTRLGGDALDVALLGGAIFAARQKGRALLAAGAVLGVAALDLLTFETLLESRRVRTADELDPPGKPVRRSITVLSSPEELYAFWREFENLPRFMPHLDSVSDLTGGHTLWRARGPGGEGAHWEAAVVEDVPNRRIRWRSIEGSDHYQEGAVHFEAAPGGRGTVVTAELRYAPPGGRIGAATLALLHKEPGQQLAEDLRRFKQVIEIGEVVVAKGGER